MNNRPVKVLVIDDNADNLITLKVLVKEHFPESIVFTAQSGKKGLQIAIDEDPDVILLDVVMPEMDGFEVCRKIKNDKKLSIIPVIFVTALKGDKEIRVNALAAGADAFLSKPVDETELTVQIRAMVRIKDAVIQKLNENQRLAALVEEKTKELKNTNLATLNLLEDLKHEIKARKEAEIELKKSDRIFNHSIDMLCIAGFDGYFKTLNPSWERILGWSTQELLSKPWVEFTHPDDVEKTKNVKAIQLDSGDHVYHFENRYICKDGSVKWLSWNSFPYPAEGIMFGVARDITEQKKAEEAIRESEDRFRTVSEYSHNAICIIDLSGKIIWANDSLTKIGGYSKEQLYATESFIQFIAPESVEFVVGNFMKFAAGEEYEHHYSFYFIKSNGEKRLCEKHMTDYKDRSGNRFLTISMMDVTDQKKAENELRESEEKFRQLAESSNAGIFIHSGDKFEYVNQTTCIQTGFSLEELCSMKFIDIIYPEDRGMVLEIWQKRLRGADVPDSYESRLNKKDGGFIWAVISGNIINYEGKPALIGTAFNITDRKKAEEVVKESEERLRLIMDAVNDAFWDWNLTTGNAVFSDNYYKILGYDIGEFPACYDSWKNLVHPEEIERVLEIINAEISKNDGYSLEFRMLEKSGNWRWVLGRGKVISRDENGSPTRMVGTHTDITDRKKVENHLKSTLDVFSKFMYYSPIYIFIKEVTSTRSIVLQASENYKNFTGISGSEMVGKTMFEMFPEEFAKKITSDDIAVVSGGKALRINEELNGRSYVTIKFPIIQKDKNMLAGYTIDITEQKKAEEELRKSEEKYRLIAENMGNVITMLDMELNYIYGTPNVERVFGFTVDEYLQLRVDQTMTPESFQIVMKTFEEEMANELSGTADLKRNRVLELEEYRKDGSTIWMENVLSYVRDEKGTPIGILSVSRDVTERRMVLEEKARLTEQLYHAQKMESVGTLAGGIAHDFNNLLQVIGGYTSMLLSVEERDIAEVDKLKTIEKAVDRASELVSNLLNFSRKNVSMKKEIDLNDEITDSIKILERTIPKMVKIKTEFDPSIPKISADPIQIEQIILNLGKNASDAMPDGGNMLIKTRIVTSHSTDCVCGQMKEGSHVELTVSDTGHGMDKETKEHVFDPFFTTKEVGKGTGLGLASVYGIVESHGGHIHCESELGKGTVFTIYFPAVDSDSDSRKVITEKTKKLEGNETVLIVDDEKNIRDIYSISLKEFGYKVITAQNGEDALVVFSENHHMIDLVILDLGMPGMGGFKCMLEMKKTVPDSKIIIASGYSEVFQTEDLIKSGASGFIQKPFKLKSVLEKIRITLDENQFGTGE